MLKLLKIGIIAAAAVAVLAWPVAWFLESNAQSVYLIHPLDEAAVAANRFAFTEDSDGSEPSDADIIAIYATSSGEPERIVFPDESRIMRPEEKPSLALYPKGSGNPLQVQFVKYVARVVSIGAAAAAAGMLILLQFLRRRRAGQEGQSAAS